MAGHRHRLLAVIALSVLCTPPAQAQIKRSGGAADSAQRLGQPQGVRHRTGVTIKASRGAVRDIRAMVAIPLECPEQSVRLIEEDYSPEVASARFRAVDGGEANQLFIRIPFLERGREAHALVTYEVVTRTIAPPEDGRLWKVPAKVDRALKRYLGPSPLIDVNHKKIRAAMALALAEHDEDAISDWEKIEAFYDFALERVDYEECDDKSSVAALADGRGDCQAVSAVFVAMCRTAEIPARMVWVKDHQYAEFYLESPDGEGLWHPIESAGTRAFGGMPTARTILQKGDNFRVPERPRERLRYASDHLKGFPTPGGGGPKVEFIREEF